MRRLCADWKGREKAGRGRGGGGGGAEVEGEKDTERVREGWRARGIEWETEMEGERKISVERQFW